MAPNIPSLPSFVCVVSSLVLLSTFPSTSFSNPIKHSSPFSPAADWQPAGATWYGSRNGSGSDGGACGYGDLVGKPPFSSMVTAGNPNLFLSGKGCGACYRVKCTNNSMCSGKSVVVTITDECPGGPCLKETIHFDLSGSAFGSLAVPGKADQLMGVGVLAVDYTRAACNYNGYTIAFHVDSGSTAYYFAVVVEYEGGDGDLSSVDLRQGGGGGGLPPQWSSMQQSWGAMWKLNSNYELKPPFSLRLTSLRSHAILVADDVIPVGWRPGMTYWSSLRASGL
ncbi:expansin-B15-like [Phalaenopsis equestris]|uniref:expansin-B15-like n=1 Tax=Phalaenopsis equestris TaxID=78828 RepID=UPI0009E648EC|nr:expansin-B15-like [Phalaenopsis equestris]